MNLVPTTAQHNSGSSLIGADMAAGKDKSIQKNINRARHFLNDAERTLDSRDEEQSVCNMANSIMTLAMLNSDLLHIHASYSAHIKAFQVRVNPACTNYEFPTVLFKEHIYLDKPNAFEQLKELEDLLIDLVADAKDKAMGGC